MKRLLVCLLTLKTLASGAAFPAQRLPASKLSPLIYSLTGPRTVQAGKPIPLILNVWNPSSKTITVNRNFCADFLIRNRSTNRVVFDSTDPVHHDGCPGLTATKPLVAGGTRTGPLSLPPLQVGDYKDSGQSVMQ